MSYTNLTVDERIAKASEYATILIDEGRLEEDVLKNLQSTFSLTHDEALTALGKMKTDHKQYYQKSMNSNIVKAIFSFIAMASGAIFYYYFGKESFKLYSWLGIFFGIVAVGVVVYLIKLLAERFNILPVRSEKNVKKEPALTIQLIIGATFLLCITLYLEWTEDGVINENEIFTVIGLQQSKNAIIDYYGSKSKTYFYEFSFVNKNVKARFSEHYYSFAQPAIRYTELPIEGTFSIQIFKKDSSLFFDPYRDKPGIIEIVNISYNNKFVVDHSERNFLVNKKHRRNRNFMTGIFLALVMLHVALEVAKKNFGMFQKK
jgi:hypothetical protein